MAEFQTRLRYLILITTELLNKINLMGFIYFLGLIRALGYLFAMDILRKALIANCQIFSLYVIEYVTMKPVFRTLQILYVWGIEKFFENERTLLEV